jgi:hypothetical protein
MTEFGILFDISFFLFGFFMVMFRDIFPFNIIWKYFRIFLLVFFGTLFWNNIKRLFNDK